MFFFGGGISASSIKRPHFKNLIFLKEYNEEEGVDKNREGVRTAAAAGVRAISDLGKF